MCDFLSFFLSFSNYFSRSCVNSIDDLLIKKGQGLGSHVHFMCLRNGLYMNVVWVHVGVGACGCGCM